ncbi:DUF397 domain-containing protein [Marinitenerispora sediminis]|uniref:DUF397 domain-containing protein n=1 Tax=Marinitenerispora sediminis TaxID=1931232 RepID=A0A368T8S9_9ACTN|nr:DUF397 domain-containing protein [Marinitenerispora sediminis]RCV52067.1 DUF397 domain-containing protein [Marinitenerispora sediminis]RCV58086.1 DUF397 domain-containing protein [Marinitenerispora sediminis]RCV60852.1 DUF397 domain-containing protein [Marinitenerispora sediminis]
MKDVPLSWRKSSYSAGNVNCVECASAPWRTSSYSSGADNCVQYGQPSPTVALRDSKYPHHGHLTLPPAEWSAFLAAAKHGEL